MNEQKKEDPVLVALTSFLPLFPEGPQALEEVPLSGARGRVLAREIAASMDNPPYARSIMEGYLVLAADVAKASKDAPTVLRVKGEMALGASDPKGLERGTCLSVTTGSFVPAGEMAVVRRFDVERRGDEIVVSRPVQSGENIEAQGCDQKKGTILFAKGKRIVPSDIYLLAAHGVVRVPVGSRPRVAIFSCGDEVIPAGEPVRAGYIRDCNCWGLSAQVEEAGGLPIPKGIVRDDFGAFLDVLKSALVDSQMVVISGGTAVGGKDFTAELVSAAGRPGTIVNGVPMRSGKPIVLGVAGGRPVVCVAGHPPEASRGFTLFGQPVISRLLGEKIAME